MSLPMDEVQTLNYLARRIHANNIAKGFYQPCPRCQGRGHHEREGAPKGNLYHCQDCLGIGSVFDPDVLYRNLCHIVREVMEIFDLTRDHTVEQLKLYTGRPGVVLIPGYEVVDPCVPAVPDKHLPGHTALSVENADILIRVLDSCRYHNQNIGQATEDKMHFNEGRALRHGRRH